MKTLKISNSVHYVGVNDRRTNLFENQLPLPYGVSYNSYLVVDEKIALVDTVEASYFDVFLQKIETVCKGKAVDYLIINHMEPDHSGAIRLICQQFPNITIVGNAKTFDMLKGYYGVIDNLLEVKDGSELQLGTSTLQFYMTPMVHWPETMMTYHKQEKILFSGDAFGCFGALNGGVIDSTMNVDLYWSEMRRYYACIVGKYGVPVQNALKKLASLPIEMLCSTHGPVWTEERAKVIDFYDKYSRYESLTKGAVVAYGSMYGNTEQMAEAIAMGISAGGVKEIVLHDVSKTDASFILADVFKYSALVIGSPTYMNELFPQVAMLLHKIEARTVKNRIFAAFGSCTWAGVSVKTMIPWAEKLQWNIVGSTEEKQALKAEKFEECYQLGLKIAEAILCENKQ